MKEGVGGLLVDEQERLVREMQEVEEKKRAVSREERLLKFTALKKKMEAVVGEPVSSKQKDSTNDPFVSWAPVQKQRGVAQQLQTYADQFRPSAF